MLSLVPLCSWRGRLDILQKCGISKPVKFSLKQYSHFFYLLFISKILDFDNFQTKSDSTYVGTGRYEQIT